MEPCLYPEAWVLSGRWRLGELDQRRWGASLLVQGLPGLAAVSCMMALEALLETEHKKASGEDADRELRLALRTF